MQASILWKWKDQRFVLHYQGVVNTEQEGKMPVGPKNMFAQSNILGWQSVLTVHYGANVFIPLFSLRFFFKNPGKSTRKHTHTRAHTMIWNSAQPCIMYMLTTQTDALDFVKHGNSELKVRKSPDRKRAKKTPDHFFYLFILSSPRAKIYSSHTGAVQLNKQHIVSHL